MPLTVSPTTKSWRAPLLFVRTSVFGTRLDRLEVVGKDRECLAENLKLARALLPPDRFAEVVGERLVRGMPKDDVIPHGMRREGLAEDDLAEGDEEARKADRGEVVGLIGSRTKLPVPLIQLRPDQGEQFARRSDSDAANLKAVLLRRMASH
jgi:hypothetical protein